MASLEEMKIVCRHLANRHSVTHEEALAVARANRDLAVSAIAAVLQEVAGPKEPHLSRARKVMRLAWDLLGADECFTNMFVAVPEGCYGHFFTAELRRNPHQFTESQLQLLQIRGDELAAAVEKARVNRVRQEAQQLLANAQELGEDLNRVQQRISEYNFSPVLNELLDKIAADFGKGDDFDQAAMMKHLRTFFEKLHQEVAEKLHAMKPDTKDGTDLTKCQQVIDHLQQQRVLSPKSQALGRALYGILSEEGVHALQSTREYVRLCRNLIAEYGLILFYELERRLEE